MKQTKSPTKHTHTHLCRSFVPGQKRTSIYHHGGVGGRTSRRGNQNVFGNSVLEGGGAPCHTQRACVCVCIIYNMRALLARKSNFLLPLIRVVCVCVCVCTIYVGWLVGWFCHFFLHGAPIHKLHHWVSRYHTFHLGGGGREEPFIQKHVVLLLLLLSLPLIIFCFFSTLLLLTSCLTNVFHLPLSLFSLSLLSLYMRYLYIYYFCDFMEYI